jgi:CHAT domain-containing protein
VVALLCTVTFSGCRSFAHQNPAVVYQNIHKEFLHGNLSIAQHQVEIARKEFARRNPDWDTKFRLLEAEVLTYQGASPDVAILLNCDNRAYPAVGDIEIKRKLLCSVAHARLGRLQGSDQELQEAQRLSAATNSSLQGEVLQTQGLAERYRGQLIKANDSFAKSLEFARQHRDTFLETADLLDLGAVDVQTEQYDAALDRFQAASQIAQSIQARLALEIALGNAGWAYYKLGDFEKSLLNFQQAKQQAQALGSTHDQVVWLTNAGLSFYQLGNQKEAESCYQEALKAAQAAADTEWISNAHTALGFLFLQQGQFDSAKVQSDEALHAAYTMGNKSAAIEPLFLQGLLAARQGNGQNAEQILMRVHQDAAMVPSLRWKIENAIANVYAQQHDSPSAQTWYKKSITTFEAQRSSLQDEELKLPFFANGNALYRDYAEFLIASHRSNEALRLLDLGRARTLEEGLGEEKEEFHLLQKEDVNPESVARKLDATILFYSLGSEKSYLWSITGGGTHLFVLPGQSEIESHVDRYQGAILKSSDPLQEENRDAIYLYNTIVAPAASTIRKDARVFIISDGSLNGLNFGTLLVPVKGKFHYWIEDATVTNAVSIRLLSRFDSYASTTNVKRLLLIGDPISPGSDYEDLPNAPVEIDSIEKHFPVASRTVLTQAAAVPAAYAEIHPERFAYIHFVAHGTASLLSPLDSAVILSPPPGHPDSFKLYARDIVHQPLHARLVTISTCYGSGLRDYAGEGLVGLSWAFLRAGAHNVIGALWEASDASTPLLMDRLYGGLQAGRRTDTALRAAKLSLIHSQGIYRKPLYWAAFQLYAGS